MTIAGCAGNSGYPKMKRAERKARQEALAANLAKLDSPGVTITKCMVDAGYSENTARAGWAGVPNSVVRLLAKKGIRLKELGKLDAETQEQLVRGRLVYNTIKGSDKGVLSAKALGSDRRVNMFTPDSQTGVIILAAPSNVQAMLPDAPLDIDAKP